LPDSWKQVLVDEIGKHESRLRVAGAKHRVFHDTIDDHVVTLVKLES